jgi:hypothetical protein
MERSTLLVLCLEVLEGNARRAAATQRLEALSDRPITYDVWDLRTQY